MRNDDHHTNHAFHSQIFSGGKNKVLYLLHTPFFYVGIHSKIQANFIGQDIKKNTVRNYRTDIGTIDILAKEKKTGSYVVIELKKNQTSDDTVGQITRYMGWLEEHKTNGEPVKGVIIAAQYDKRLYYALKKMKDIEVYLYRVDFKLKEFNQTT